MRDIARLTGFLGSFYLVNLPLMKLVFVFCLFRLDLTAFFSGLNFTVVSLANVSV